MIKKIKLNLEMHLRLLVKDYKLNMSKIVTKSKCNTTLYKHCCRMQKNEAQLSELFSGRNLLDSMGRMGKESIRDKYS